MLSVPRLATRLSSLPTLVPASTRSTTCQAQPSAMTGSRAVLAPNSVWAVGKNYLEHIKELKGLLDMGNEVPKEPLIFLKSGSSVLSPPPAGQRNLPQELPLPVHWSNDIQHEVELAIEVGANGRPQRAAIAIDMTARDVQAQLKKQGYPWTLAKSFIASCPLGTAFEVEGVDLQRLEIGITVNGKQRQVGNTSDMIFSIDQLLEYLEGRFPIQQGDVLLTGTPEGVARLVPGDVVAAWVKEPSTGRVLSEGLWVCTAAKPSKM